jgi:hydroxyacyl-ACP dehydratase HTD2-like protein with hotdog domain
VSVSADSVREGDAITPLQLTPDLRQVIRFCGMTWNFPAFFYDIEAARAQGMPGTLVPGPLKLGLIYRAVAEWLGDAGFVRHVRAAHRRPDITNRPMTILGQIARVYEEAGRRRADIDVTIQNEQGEPSVRGFAVVEFFH